MAPGGRLGGSLPARRAVRGPATGSALHRGTAISGRSSTFSCSTLVSSWLPQRGHFLIPCVYPTAPSRRHRGRGWGPPRRPRRRGRHRGRRSRRGDPTVVRGLRDRRANPPPTSVRTWGVLGLGAASVGDARPSTVVGGAERYSQPRLRSVGARAVTSGAERRHRAPACTGGVTDQPT